MQLNELNKRLLEILGLSSESAQIVIDRIEELKGAVRAQHDEITYLKKRAGELRIALAEIDSEASGALNNAFPDEAPDVLSNVAGIARRALSSPNNPSQTAAEKL